LGHLVRFPFDRIKIGRTFTSRMPTRPDCAAVVCAIIGLGRSLDIVTVAGGIETYDQLNALRAAGVDQVQGSLFGPPVAGADVHFNSVNATLLGRRPGVREGCSSVTAERRPPRACRLPRQRFSRICRPAGRRPPDAGTLIFISTSGDDMLDLTHTLPTWLPRPLAGRVWRPDSAGPSVVAVRDDGVFDVTAEFPTMTDLTEADDPAQALRRAPNGRQATSPTFSPIRARRRAV
jgi:hypothetical protein